MTAITGSNVWTRIITFLGGLDASRDKQHTILETIELSDDPWLEIGPVEKARSQCTAPYSFCPILPQLQLQGKRR